MIEIRSPGLGATVQDLGRYGHRSIGVGSCGAMDARALRLANALLGNPEGAAGIEFTLGGFGVEALEEIDICLAGAEAGATLDGQPLPRWWVQTLRPGQRLRAGLSRTGMRIYLALGGGIELPEVLGSRSTDLKSGFGGLEGRMLKAGDRLCALAPRRFPRRHGFGLSPRAWPELWDEHGEGATLRFIPAAEWKDLDAENQSRFIESDWRVSPDSNRIGYRFEGSEIVPKARRELLSHGILPGTIQLPPSGQPMVQLSDANTAGGYPKLGVVIDADLPLLAQAPLGSKVRFCPCSVADARGARNALLARITNAGQRTALLREGPQ